MGVKKIYIYINKEWEFAAGKGEQILERMEEKERNKQTFPI